MPRTGRRPGPTSTRDEILRAARKRFAQHGYDRATFRTIAADAGVDPALVVQFFGSKQELFVAATTSPITLAELSDQSAADPYRFAQLLLEWLSNEDARDAVIARIRSAATEPAAAEMVRAMIGGQIVEFAKRLDGDDAEVRASLMATQFLGVVWARHVVQLEPLASMAPDDVATWLGRSFEQAL
jgi:AcrR family transcriptional regulator